MILPPAPSLSNAEILPGSVSASVATAQVDLAVSPATNLVAYWGTVDKAETFAWAATNDLGEQAIANDIEAALTNLSADTEYFYIFYATNSSTGQSGWSATNQSFVTAIDTPPTITSATPGSDSVTLGWGGTFSTEQAFYVTVSNAGSVVTQYLADADAASGTVSSLDSGTAYSFAIAASNAVGLGPWSDATNVATAAALTLSGAEIVPGSISASTATGQVDLTGVSATGLYAYWGTTDAGKTFGWTGGTNDLGATSVANDIQAALTNLTADMQYHYIFYGTNTGTGESDWSETNQSFVTAIDTAPTITSSTTGVDNATFDWSGSFNTEEAFYVSYSTNGGSNLTTYLAFADATSATVSNLAGGTVYTFAIAASNAVGLGPWSGVLSVTTDALWSPNNSTGATPVAWFDASDLSTLSVTNVSGTDYVSQWNDKSSDHHLTQTSQSLRLKSGTRTIGSEGLNALEGSNDGYMNLSSLVTNTGPLALFWVCDIDSVASCIIGDGGNSIKWGQWGGSTYGYRFTDGSFAGSVTGGRTGSPYLGMTLKDAAGKIWAGTDGSMADTGKSNGLGAPTWSTIPHVGTKLDGALGEVIIVADDLAADADTRQRIEGYLAWKWGIPLPVGHPYENAAPVTQPPTPAFSGAEIISVSANTATARVDLADADATTLYAYWGTSDAGETSGWTGGTNNLGAKSIASDIDAALTNLTADTQYYYIFHGTNSGSGQSGWSETNQSFVTAIDTAPFITNTMQDVDSVTLQWSGTFNTEDAFYVRYNTNGGPIVTQYLATADETSGTVSGLDTDTAYDFAVAVSNAVGLGPWSGTTTVSTLGPPPTLSGATIVAGSVGANAATVQVDLADASVSNLVAYWGTTDEGETFGWTGGTNELGTTDTGTGIQAALTGLDADSVYYYIFYGVNTSSGQSDWSETNRSFMTAIDTSPTISGTTPGGFAVTLDWSGTFNTEDAFYVRYSDGGATVTQSLAAADASSGTVSGLDPDTAYSFAVAASNAVGLGPWSAAANVSTLGPPTLSGAEILPASVSAHTATARVDLAISDATGLFVYWGTIDAGKTFGWTGGTNDLAAQAVANDIEAALTNLTADMQYYYIFYANDSGSGLSDWSETNQSFVTAIDTAPTITSSTTGVDNVTLEWSGTFNTEDAFYIRYSDGVTTVTQSIAAANATSGTVSGLDDDTLYTFTVAAGNAAGLGPWSGTTNVTTDLDLLWYPDYATGCTVTVWYDASDLSTLSVTNASGTDYVTQWNDKSTNSNHLTQSDQALRLTTRDASKAINGLNTVVSVSGANHMVTTSPIPRNTGNTALFWVAKLNNTGSGLLLTPGLTSNARFGLLNSNTMGYRFVNNFLSWNFTTPSPSWGSGTVHIGVHYEENRHLYGGLDGKIKDGGDRSSSGSAYSAGWQYIPGPYNSAGAWDGPIAEIIIITGDAVPEVERKKIEGYLAWKWGTEANLPAGHPYEDAAPEIPAPDTTPPVWSNGWPKVDGLTAVGGTARAKVDEDGTAYFVVLADGATDPGSEDVRAGTGTGGASAVTNGTIALTAGTEATKAFAGLNANTPYDVWFVAEDDEATPNLQTTPQKVDVTTTALSPLLSNAEIVPGSVSASVATARVDLTVSAATSLIAYWGTTDAGQSFGWTGGTNELGAQAVANDIEAALTNLTADMQYYYIFYANDSGSGLSDWSETNQSFVTAINTVPTITNATPGVDNVTLGWSGAFNSEDAFTVRYSDGVTTVTQSLAAANDTSGTVLGLADNTLYTFAVAASNAVGLGPWSGTTNIRTEVQALWRPDSVRGGKPPIVWFDASDPSTLFVTNVSGTDYVSQWNDKSVSGNHLTQTSQSLRLRTGARTIGSEGLNALEGSNDAYMTLASGVTNTGPLALFWVCDIDSVASCIIGDGGNSIKWGQWGGSAYGYRFTDGSFAGSVTGGRTGSPYLGMTLKDAAGKIWAGTDGSMADTGKSNGLGAPTWSTIPHVGTKLDGALGEVIIVADDLAADADTRQRIEGYLAWKWGITLDAGHPYENAAPEVPAAPGTMFMFR